MMTNTVNIYSQRYGSTMREPGSSWGLFPKSPCAKSSQRQCSPRNQHEGIGSALGLLIILVRRNGVGLRLYWMRNIVAHCRLRRSPTGYPAQRHLSRAVTGRVADRVTNHQCQAGTAVEGEQTIN